MRTKKIISYATLSLLIACSILPTQINSYAGVIESRPTITLDVDGESVTPTIDNYDNTWSFNSIVNNDSVWNKIKIDKDSASSIKFNNNPVYSGDYVYAPSLGLGTNIYNINVDGYNYNLNIYKKYPSEYYNLNLLKTRSEWGLNFNPNILEYNLNATTNATCTGIDIKPISNTNISQTVKVNDKYVDIYTYRDKADNNYIGWTDNIPINTGLNKISVVVKSFLWNTLIDEKTYTLNLTKIEPSNTGGGTSSGGSGGSVSTGTASSTISLSTTVDSDAKAVVVSVPQDKLTSLFNLLKENTDSVKIAVIEVPKKDNLNNYKIELPVSAFGNTSTGVTLDTNVGSLTLMDTMLQDSLKNSTEKVGINIGAVDKSTLSQEVLNTVGDKPIVSLNMTLDGKTTEWNNPDSPVIVSIPYAPTTEELANPEKIIVYYIDGNNNLNTISNARYDSQTGSVVFSTTHFSNYAIAYNNKTFTDITDKTAKHAIEVLASKGIVNGKTKTTFEPSNTITRAEFITLLTRAFELNKSFTNNFTDVNSNQYYYKPVGIAKELNIINGIDGTHFNPNGLITKSQVEIIINNVAKVKGLNSEKVKTALNSVSDEKGITRDEICVMIYNLIK